ncbi:MAG: adenosine deaminase [Clostridiales bacterium]|nr:adenosine deaminase [Clostridiales bacterium]
MIDLHLHLDGSLRPKTVLELGAEQGISLPAKTLETLIEYLRVPEDCKSLTEYLERFDLPLEVLQVPSAIERVTFELVEDLAFMGLEYAEIRFAPQLSTKKGLTQEEVVKAAISGLDKALSKYTDIKVQLILCCMRGKDNDADNYETLEVAKKYLSKGVCAVDLAGAEALFKTKNYKELFEKVNEFNLPFTIHAGEADGPESVKEAISYGARRIGHGVRSIEDEDLIKELIEKGVTLEVCPISNLQTKTVDDIRNHPIRRLFDLGVRVTVNTDNMTVSNTTLQKEKLLLKEALGFTDKEFEVMEVYSKEAAFGEQNV